MERAGGSDNCRLQQPPRRESLRMLSLAGEWNKEVRSVKGEIPTRDCSMTLIGAKTRLFSALKSIGPPPYQLIDLSTYRPYRSYRFPSSTTPQSLPADWPSLLGISTLRSTFTFSALNEEAPSEKPQFVIRATVSAFDHHCRQRKDESRR